MEGEKFYHQFEEGLKSISIAFNDQQKAAFVQNQKNEELIKTLNEKNLSLEQKIQDSIRLNANLEQQLRDQKQENDKVRKDLGRTQLKYMNLKKVTNQLEEFRRNMVGIIKNTVIASTEDSFGFEESNFQNSRASRFSQDHSVDGILDSNYHESIDAVEDIQQTSFRSSQNMQSIEKSQNRTQNEIKKFNPFKDNHTSSIGELIINESALMPTLDPFFVNNEQEPREYTSPRNFVQPSDKGPRFHEYSSKSDLLINDPEYKKYMKGFQSKRNNENESKFSNESKHFGSIDDITIQSSYPDELRSYSPKGSETKLLDSFDYDDGLRFHSSKGSDNRTKSHTDPQYSINYQHNLTEPKIIAESLETNENGKEEMDPGKLYKIIREKIGFDEFEKFAKCIGEFNSGTKGTEETISVISKLLRDENLCYHMKQLILSVD